MSDKSAIGWTEATWNPVTGCSRVSPGCAHCYMFTAYPRLKAMGNPSYQATADTVVLQPQMLDKPLHWKRPRRIFVNSMSDLFHEEVPDTFIDSVFAVMMLTPQHTYQILTKRPARMRDYLNNGSLDRYVGIIQAAAALRPDLRLGPDTFAEIHSSAIRNVWLGVSVEDQIRADERIPILLDTPAAMRFLSCEPLLGPIDLNRIGLGAGEAWRSAFGTEDRPGVDWVIAGGESGPGARECSERWLSDLRNQTHAAWRPYFLKQLGGHPDKRAGSKAKLGGRTWTQFPGDHPDWLQRSRALLALEVAG